ncbi:MAG: ABC transporter permease, partial [Acidobacteria bacterium]|nr:ABC transporter permease [Acidobacteriota bacterium]
LFYSLSGGLLGLLSSYLFTLRGDPTGGFLPAFYISLNQFATGVFLILVFGFASGAIPARRAYKLKIVDALGRV